MTQTADAVPFESPVAVRAAIDAMATRFEILVYGTHPPALRAAAEEALAEVRRLESRLSFYRPDSEIARLNQRGGTEPVRILPEVWTLLERAVALGRATDGAFDITVAPLLEAWGFAGGTGHRPDPETLHSARNRVGLQYLRFDRLTWSVSFEKPGMRVDLGGIGKGYAIEQAVEILRDAGVTSALIHGGTSTAYGLGAPPEAEAWQVAIEPPPELRRPDAPPLAVVSLRDRALSVSAVWGRAFTDAEGLHGHVIDPRTGQPVSRAVLAAVVTRSPTDADALSTALLVLGAEGLNLLARQWPDLQALVLGRCAGQWHVQTRGLTPHPAYTTTDPKT
jgi:thiamine biosynthesis lipoprotein